MNELIRTLNAKASVARTQAKQKMTDSHILEGLARGFEEAVLDIQKAAPKSKKKAKRKANKR